MATKGIFLIAYGKRGYIFSAYNFAFSIKYFNKELPITLFADESIKLLSANQQKVFDNIIAIPADLRQSSAAQIKISALDILPYDETLFLDVDAVALKDLTPIFDELSAKDGCYYARTIGETKHFSKTEGLTFEQWRIIPHMIWAYADDIWNKYSLSEDAVLPSTNSSFQYIKKCDESKALIEQIKENFANPIPNNELRTAWGGGQPDELYLNIALAQKGINPKADNDYLFLGSALDKRTTAQLENDYFILSLFGHRNMTRPKYKEWYDSLLIKYHRAHGQNHNYKSHTILTDKHANIRAPQVTRTVKDIKPVNFTSKQKSNLKILLKFPTRSRPEKFLHCLSKAFELASDKENIKALVNYDSDDKTMTQEIIDKAKTFGNVECISGVSKNKIDAVNRDMDKSGEWDILVLLSDDMECEIKGWDNILRDKFEDNKDRLVHFNDGYRGQEIMTLAIMDRAYYNRFNYIYHPDYTSLWCDNEQMDVGRKLNRYRYYPQVLFRHKMAMNGFAQDELHKHTESFFDADKKVYESRRRKGFPKESVLKATA